MLGRVAPIAAGGGLIAANAAALVQASRTQTRAIYNYWLNRRAMVDLELQELINIYGPSAFLDW